MPKQLLAFLNYILFYIMHCIKDIVQLTKDSKHADFFVRCLIVILANVDTNSWYLNKSSYRMLAPVGILFHFVDDSIWLNTNLIDNFNSKFYLNNFLYKYYWSLYNSGVLNLFAAITPKWSIPQPFPPCFFYIIF